MHVISRLIFIALFATATCAFADDLFADGAPREIKKFSSVASGTTMGGYPLYDGAGNWRLISTAVTSTTNLNIKLGRVHLFSPTASSYLAQMIVGTNLSQASENGYYSDDPCENKVSALYIVNKGAGRRDNCMSMSSYNLPVDGRDTAALLVRIRNSQSNWRIYDLTLLLNPGAMGFANTVVGDWSRDSIAADPRKQRYMDKLLNWAGKLQDAVNTAIGFDKPQNAFAGVPSLASLADTTTN